jgi:hypothetical protein
MEKKMTKNAELGGVDTGIDKFDRARSGVEAIHRAAEIAAEPIDITGEIDRTHAIEASQSRPELKAAAKKAEIRDMLSHADEEEAVIEQSNKFVSTVQHNNRDERLRQLKFRTRVSRFVMAGLMAFGIGAGAKALGSTNSELKDKPTEIAKNADSDAFHRVEPGESVEGLFGSYEELGMSHREYQEDLIRLNPGRFIHSDGSEHWALKALERIKLPKLPE